MSASKTYRFMLSGGGTGGHLFPAIAIANELKKRFPGSEFLFVGAKGRMEMTKVPENNYKIVGLWISGFQRSQPWKNLLLPFKIISSLYKSARLIKKFKPNAVVGTGGYASFALVYAAARQKIPSLIQEQNFFPGITNKYLAKYADIVCTVYEEMDQYFPASKIRVCGNPVRESIRKNALSKEEAIKSFGLDPAKKCILLIGGSLGAGTLNRAMKNGLEAIIDHDIQLIWQCGAAAYDQLAELQLVHHKQIVLKAFISDMPAAYTAADVVISRAGAISLSELAIMGKACVLVPSPNVAEDHQTKNALALVKKNAALLVKDAEADRALLDTVFDLLGNADKMNELAANIESFAEPRAAEKIVDEIEKLIQK